VVFVDVVVLGVALGLASGGSIAAVGRLAFRRAWLFYAALLLQTAAFLPPGLPWHLADGTGRALWIASYAFLVAGAAANLRLPGVAVAAAGLVSNAAAVVANGGRMPALPSAIADAGSRYVPQGMSVPLAEPRLGWLVDRWAVPHWIPLGNVFSAGDAVLATGTLILLVAATRLGGSNRMTLRRRGGLGECEARTQGTSLSGR
jgi:hypothetical protein